MSANEYMSWMRGWKDGTHATIQREQFTDHTDPGISSAYSDGYAAGRKAANDASKHASDTYGYKPVFVREKT